MCLDCVPGLENHHRLPFCDSGTMVCVVAGVLAKFFPVYWTDDLVSFAGRVKDSAADKRGKIAWSKDCRRKSG